MQWTQDKLRHRADKEREGMKKEDVVEQLDEKRRETATWASDHKATHHPPYPPTPHNPPQNLLASHPRLSAPLSS